MSCLAGTHALVETILAPCKDGAKVGVIFDCDGTLLDSMGMWHALDERLAARAGVEFSQADRDRLTAATLPESAQFLHEQFGVGTNPQDVMRMMDEELFAYYRTEAAPKPGALELVRALDAEGVPMAVASSTPSEMLRTGLEVAGFAPYMRAIVSVDDVGVSKREPAVYDKARASLDTTRAQTWGVEDALYAIRTLKHAGYRTLAVFDSLTAGSPDDLRAEADVFTPSFAL